MIAQVEYFHNHVWYHAEVDVVALVTNVVVLIVVSLGISVVVQDITHRDV